MSLPANFPASLDALANPTATTNRDDGGFELDLVVSRIHDILEALEAKVGVGASLPTTAGVLRRTAPGTTAWGTIQTADLAALAVGQIVSVGLPSTSTNSTTFVGLALSNLNIVATGRPVLVGVTLIGYTNASAAAGGLQLWESPSTVRGTLLNESIPAGSVTVKTSTTIITPTAGSHDYLLAWNTTTGVVSINEGRFWMLEIK